MSRHYKLPCLLIEFDPNKAFSLQVRLNRTPTPNLTLASP